MGNNVGFELDIVGRHIEKLSTARDIQKVVADMPTPELVSTFTNINSYTKKLEKIQGVMKKELVDNTTMTGRITESTYTDDKGNRYLKGENGEGIKFERRMSIKFNEEKAAEVLDRYDLFIEGSDKTIVLPDAETTCVMLGKIERRLNSLIVGNHIISAEVVAELQDLKKMVGSICSASFRVNEQKVEQLVADGKIPRNAVEDLVDIKTIFAIKEHSKGEDDDA